LAIVAVTTAVPSLEAVKVLPLIIALVFPAFAIVHTIVWFVALEGITTPFKISGIFTIAAAGTSFILSTGCITVMLKSRI
jgi:hypothetical protein